MNPDQVSHSKQAIVPPLPVTITDEMVPLRADGRYVPHYLDADGTAHWFSLVEANLGVNPAGEPYQMRYFRAARDAKGGIIHDSYPVMPVARIGGSPSPLPTLEIMLEDGDLATAYELASGTASLYGLSFPEATELHSLIPPNEQEIALREATNEFSEQFSNSAYQLLEPIDHIVNYSFAALAADPWTLELTADKWWLDAEGEIAQSSATLATYSLEWSEFEKELEHERATIDLETLRRTYREEGLEASMRRAEAIAVAHGELDPNRVDGRLFQAGPQDRFTTLREIELSGMVHQPLEFVSLDITNDDTAEIPSVTPEAGSWEELLQITDMAQPQIEEHYWQLGIKPVSTPDGVPLGHALFCTEFPQLPPDFDHYVAEFGRDDAIYPTQARILEMAHFKTETEAKIFGDEFRRYLIPGVIEGPELAPDVARLEGLSGSWEALDYQAIVDYMSDEKTVIREREHWHLHIPVEDLQRLDEFNSSLIDL